MARTGQDIVKLAKKHVGEKYVYGSIAPKDNARWKGPWDCAEFTSWLVFQLTGRLYGCADNSGRPATADAYTGYWMRDAGKLGKKVSVAEAARTPGAMLVRHSGVGRGHIVVCRGDGGTVEAHSTARGLIEHTVSGRRWDAGVLTPGFTYRAGAGGDGVTPPKVVIYLLSDPMMRGDVVKQIQRALKAAGFDPGPIDGVYGGQTAAAVASYQAARRLIADGEVGPTTARSLGITLPRA